MIKVGIIGFGDMGEFWAKLLSRFSVDIMVYDINDIHDTHRNSYKVANTLEDICKHADYIHLLIPYQHCQEVCTELKNYIKPDTLIIGGFSIMVKPAKIITKTFSDSVGIIMGHALFGPNSGKNGVEGFDFVFSEQGIHNENQQEKLEVFKEQISDLKLNIKYITAKDHDKKMAKTQALMHLIGRMLDAMELDEEEITTKTFRDLISIKNMVVGDSDDLFHAIQKSNPYAREIHHSMLKILKQIENEIYMEKSLLESDSEDLMPRPYS